MTYSWPKEVILAVSKGEISSLEGFKLLKTMDNSLDIPAAAADSPREELQALMQEMDGLIGLSEVKKLVREIYAFIEIQKRRETEGLHTQPLVLHMIFKGNPGTGKTTVARILGKMFCKMGVLSRGHLIEVERADLVGEYIGHTAQKTREQLKKAYGGILFIDEAYSLARGGEKDFGKESIDVLVKAMEDHRGEIILILAGYQAEMENFLKVNPGLRSRFPIHIDFPDYSEKELLSIAELFCQGRQYQLTSEAKLALLKILSLPSGDKGDNFGNARAMRNLIEKAIRRQAVRLITKPHLSRDELMLLSASDLAEGKE